MLKMLIFDTTVRVRKINKKRRYGFQANWTRMASALILDQIIPNFVVVRSGPDNLTKTGLCV